MTVTTSPDQTVIVGWSTGCSQNGGAPASISGTFTGRTPFTHTLPHVYAQPAQCDVGASSGVVNYGSVHISLSFSPVTHEIKGYANLCADDTGNSAARGNKIETWACDNGASQQWAFSHGELVHRGMCMNDKADGGSGSPVVLYTCTGAANELWTHNAHGEYVLKARNGTLCLDGPAYSKKNGTPLVVYTCHDTANQHWTLP